jgi:hypothetical protein
VLYIRILNPARLPIPPSGQSVDIQQVDNEDLHCYTCEKVKMYHFCISCKQKGNMKEWLDNQRKIEDSLLNAVAIESKEIAEDLMPQVRLCALENEMASSITFRVNFEFLEDGSTDIWSEGVVDFPPKQSVSKCYRVDAEAHAPQKEEVAS